MAHEFGARSTTDEVLEGVDLQGKRVLVTGVSAGLGAETARVLAAHGARVVGAARDLAKARATVPDGVILVPLDLASLASVRACADQVVAAGEPLDVIIANAGVMACPFGKTADGFETQFGTNHLGHFVLVNRLASLLAPGARVVSLASAAHHRADVNLDDPNFERTPYDNFLAYSRSKTANVLFAVEFDRRHKARGVRATAVHPGVIPTELPRHMKPGEFDDLIATIRSARPGFEPKTIPQGAATSVWAGIVAAADEVGGRYCEDCHVAETTPPGGARVGVQSYALDPERAQALWALSERLVGETF